MTPEDLARVHAAAFVAPRPWSGGEIAGLLANPLTFLITESQGFLIGRVVADEAELLTLAVSPAARRHGTGRALVAGFLIEARSRGATQAFLEVAADNAAAIALYLQAEFTESGRRKRYYTAPDGTAIDALVLSRAL